MIVDIYKHIHKRINDVIRLILKQWKLLKSSNLHRFGNNINDNSEYTGKWWRFKNINIQFEQCELIQNILLPIRTELLYLITSALPHNSTAFFIVNKSTYIHTWIHENIHNKRIASISVSWFHIAVYYKTFQFLHITPSVNAL